MTMSDTIHVTHLTDTPATDTPTTETPTTETPTTDTAAAAVLSTGELVHVAASDVVIEDNVRTSRDLDPAFLASIKQHGVLLPTIGYRTESGAVVVRDGQLRVLAAREHGQTVPVLITERSVSESAWLVEQVVTNDRRTALTDADRIAAYRQMELAGLSVTQIAKQTGTKRDRVKDTLTVAKSTAAAGTVADLQVSFDTALVLAEFDGDDAALTELHDAVEQWGESQLPFVAERLRQDRTRREQAAGLRAEYDAAGVLVVDADADTFTHLYSLTDTEPEADTPRSAIVAANHMACAGRAVLIRADYGTPTAAEVCTTPDAHHVLHRGYGAAPRPKGPMTDEEKAARKALIAGSKAWDAATTIRRTWLGGFFARKTMPKDAGVFVAATLTGRHRMVGEAQGEVSVRDLLGIDPDNRHGDAGVADWVATHPTKAAHVSVAVVVAAYENTSSRDWWRYPNRDGAAYLTLLQAWGYVLSDVERLAAGISDDTATEDAAADDTAAGDAAAEEAGAE